MKRKTINKVIKQKMEDWIASIDDKELRKKLKEDIIVTGGCITSMFLQEKINDFDVYLRTKETAKEVATYYVNKFYEKYPDKYIIEVIVDKDRISIKVHSEGLAEADDAEENMLEDPDLLGDNELLFAKEEEKSQEKYRPMFLSTNAITLSDKIQVIIRFYGTPEEIHKNYDFKHVTNYWTFDEGLVTNTRALECILSKELLYCGSKYPLASIIRTRKFIRRGWTINAGQYLKMAFQLNELNLSDPEVLEEQLTGVDIFYMHQVIKKLKQKREEDQDMDIKDYFLSVVSKIFD